MPDMGFLIVLVVLFVVGVVVVMGVSGWAALGLAARDETKVKELEANPGPVLDELFDGSPQVVYAPKHSSGGLTTATLVKGAGERGYRMVSETGRMATRTVVFEKVTRPISPYVPRTRPPRAPGRTP